MARGLLHGATVTLTIGLISILFAMFSPMWLVLRTELEEKQCWYGEGIWTSRFWWGSDLPLANMKCTDPKGLGPFSTTEAYCQGMKPVFKHDKPDYNREMCNATNHAKITSTLASLFAVAAVAVCSFMGLAGGASTSSTFCVRAYCKPLSRRNEFSAILLALTSAVGAMVFTFATTVIMLNSPLFSSSHRDAISHTQNGRFFKGFSSCSFQTPMHSIFSLLKSGPMECLFGGPSFFSTLIIFICEGLGVGFLLMLAKDVWIRKSIETASTPSNNNNNNTGRGSLEVPLLNSASSGRDEQMFPTRYERADSGFQQQAEEEHDDVLPPSFRKVRRYSLYGAFARRFSKWGPLPKFCLLTIAPVVFMAGNAIAWAAYSMLGIQIIVSAEMSFVSSKSLSFVQFDENSLATKGQNATVWNNPPSLLVDQLNVYLDRLRAGHDGLDKSNNMMFSLDGNTFFRDIMNVFNFSPVTSLEYFWDTKAYLIAVAVFFAIFIIPISKVVCWIWFFYSPSDEIFRGRFLDGLDAIGKYALANLYVLCFLAIALCFDSDFIKIPLGRSTWFLFQIRASINAGNGIGSYMYVLTSIMSLLIGQFMCQVHAYASIWEEDRRAKHGLCYKSRDEDANQQQQRGDDMSLESPNYSAGDTPYLDSISTGFTPSIAPPSANIRPSQGTTTSGQRVVRVIPPTIERGASADDLLPTFKSLASFGSTADLQRLQSGGTTTTARTSQSTTSLSNAATRGPPQLRQVSSTASAQPPEIMRALASYGSRTALNVLAARSERIHRNASRISVAIDEEDDESDHLESQDEERGAVRKANYNINKNSSRTSLEEEQEEEEAAGYVVDLLGSAQSRPPSSSSSLRGLLSEPLHPYVEAMCDRIHSPNQGTRLKWTPRGKIFIWMLIFILAGFMLICQSWDLVEIHKKGIGGDIIVEPKDRYRLYSLVSFTGNVAKTGYEVPAMELSLLFFLMTAIMPIATVLGLAMLWTIPLTIDQQVGLFRWLEIASAWSSLDIFFISLVGMYVELKDVTDKIITDAVPNVSELIRILLPFEDGPMSAEMKLQDGFWILLIAVFLEKIAIYLITENAVTAISERKVEKFLRDLAKQTAAAQRAQQRQFQQLQQHGGNSGSGGLPPGSSGPGRLDTGLLGDAAEGLLETEAMLVFAPVGRYTSAMFPRHIYGGLPRSWWVKIGVRFGLLADAKTVQRYDQTGEWFSLDDSNVEGHHHSSGFSPLATTSPSGTANSPLQATRGITATQQKPTQLSGAVASTGLTGEMVLKRTNERKGGNGKKATANRDDQTESGNKKVSWGTRLDEEQQQHQLEEEDSSSLLLVNQESSSKLSFGGEEDGPLSF